MPEKEQDLLRHIRSLPNLDEIKGHPLKLLKAIDDYAVYKGEHFMTIGQDKGVLIIDEIKKVTPKTVIELGGYVGYSAILFSNELGPDGKYYSFEVNEEFAAIAQEFIDLVGLTSKIQIILGPAATNLVPFAEKLKTKADFIFIDHWKNLYVPDFRVLETLNLIGKGTVITADNILRPGVPEYAKYVKLSPEERKVYNETHENEAGKQFPGKWQNVYKSETVPVGSDGVEVTYSL